MAKPTRSEVTRWTQEFLNNVGPHVAVAVEKSFLTQGMRNPTSAAVKERIDWCWVMVKILKLELRWSLSRIRDRLPDMLRRHLNGERVDLDAEPTVWVPPVGDEYLKGPDEDQPGGLILP